VTPSAPFPSRGKGRGWGGGSESQDVAHEASSDSGADVSDYDRFAGPARIKPGGVQRAQRLRKIPTHAEAKLWERLRRFDIRIRRQVALGPYVVDFACLRAKLVIEVDGGVHERTDVALRDLERDAWLTGQGFHVIRVPNKRVESELDAVVLEIDRAVRAKVRTRPASTPSQPFPLEGKGSSDL
jgi:very-short-patch-repair endonuclease